MACFPEERIDILKMDTKGPESELSADGAEAWMPHVRNIIVETHGEESAEQVLWPPLKRPDKSSY